MSEGDQLKQMDRWEDGLLMVCSLIDTYKSMSMMLLRLKKLKNG